MYQLLQGMGRRGMGRRGMGRRGMGRRGILIYLRELLYVDESQLKFNFVFRRNLFAIKGVNIYSSTAQSF